MTHTERLASYTAGQTVELGASKALRLTGPQRRRLAHKFNHVRAQALKVQSREEGSE